MKNSKLILALILSAFLLVSGIFGGIAFASTNVTPHIAQQNTGLFSARLSIRTGAVPINGLSARITNLNTSRSEHNQREGNNLTGNVASPTVFLELGHRARGSYQYRRQASQNWTNVPNLEETRVR